MLKSSSGSGLTAGIRWKGFAILCAAVIVYAPLCFYANSNSNAFNSGDAWIPTLPQNDTTALNDVTFASMPGITFPLFSNNYTRLLAGEMELTVSHSGGGGGDGCESKLFVQSPEFKFIFKPSHVDYTEEQYNYGYRPSKGGFVRYRKHHPAKILNELIAYETAGILGLQHRIPPVFPFEISSDQFQQAVTAAAAAASAPAGPRALRPFQYFGCQMDVTGERWLRRNKTQTANAIIGSLQFKMDHIQQLSAPPPRYGWFVSWLRRAAATVVAPPFAAQHTSAAPTRNNQERNTRQLFDYLIGNWDRYPNNNFAEERTGQLVYIDQNALRHSEVPFDLELPLTASLCRFYRQPVELLRAAGGAAGRRRSEGSSKNDNDRGSNRSSSSNNNNNRLLLSETVWDRLTTHDIVADWVKDKVIQKSLLGPLRYMDTRRQVLLDRVDACVDRYGAQRVFRD